jgi:hypothetical protein
MSVMASGYYSQVASWFDFLLPTWLRSLISTVSSIGLMLASGVAVLLYRNQVFKISVVPCDL